MSHIIAAFQCIDEITENEKLQQNKLANVLVAAEDASRAKTNFLNNISHDIRTHLNAIIGFTSLAKLHIGDKDAVEKYLSKIAVSGNHLLLLINDVFDMSHIENCTEKGFAKYKIKISDNGITAVEKIKSSPAGTYDIVLMDIQMPNMDGYEATRQIRNLSDNKINSIPNFALTANAFESNKQKALYCGMNGFISKPIDMPKLIKTINDVVL